MNVIVDGKNVVKRYGDFTAVDSVDFSVDRGECFGFLGPNGAGKTSVMKMIQRLAPVSGGEITVDGLIAGIDDRAIKAAIGYAPQESSLDNDLSVVKNLVIYARYFGISGEAARSRTEELLLFFHLDEKKDTHIRELSGGMVRRLIIARALINNPKILILDEPTTGLDPQARRLIWGKMKELKQKGVTILLTTHYMDEAAKLCDRVALMDDGKILMTGTPSDLVESKVGTHVVEFTAREPVEPILEKLGEPFEKLDGLYSVYTSNPEMVNKTIEGAVERKPVVRASNLEDLFFRLAGKTLAGSD